MVLEVHNSVSAIEPYTMAEATARRPFFRPITPGEFVTCKYDAAGMVKEMASAPVEPKMPHITDTDGITTASRNCDAYRAKVHPKIRVAAVAAAAALRWRNCAARRRRGSRCCGPGGRGFARRFRPNAEPEWLPRAPEPPPAQTH